jgi:hypothetical protein
VQVFGVGQGAVHIKNQGAEHGGILGTETGENQPGTGPMAGAWSHYKQMLK